MKTTLALLICASILLAGGCKPSNRTKVSYSDGATNTVQGKNIKISIMLPRRDWQVGQTIPVEVTAVNTTGSAVSVVSPTGAPVLVRVMRPSKGSFEQVRLYPASATSNIVNWTLPARGTRTFKLMVPVEPDWPAAESLRLTAELNGYPKYAPAVTIMVQAKP